MVLFHFAQFKRCVLQLGRQDRLHVFADYSKSDINSDAKSRSIVGVLTLLARRFLRLCSTQLLQFQVTFLDQRRDLPTQLQCLNLQRLAVRKERVFDPLHVQFLQVFH